MKTDELNTHGITRGWETGGNTLELIQTNMTGEVELSTLNTR